MHTRIYTHARTQRWSRAHKHTPCAHRARRRRRQHDASRARGGTPARPSTPGRAAQAAVGAVTLQQLAPSGRRTCARSWFGNRRGSLYRTPPPARQPYLPSPPRCRLSHPPPPHEYLPRSPGPTACRFPHPMARRPSCPPRRPFARPESGLQTRLWTHLHPHPHPRLHHLR